MKIAVPVVDDSLKMAGNAGHTPYFAVYNLKGGMFRSFELEGLRANPKVAGKKITITIMMKVIRVIMMKMIWNISKHTIRWQMRFMTVIISLLKWHVKIRPKA